MANKTKQITLSKEQEFLLKKSLRKYFNNLEADAQRAMRALNNERQFNPNFKEETDSQFYKTGYESCKANQAVIESILKQF
jgi:hypothetical protein